MKPIVTTEIREVMDAVHYRPAVSIIMPFESKISLKTELAHSLKTTADKVQLELQQNYPKEMTSLIMQKLRSLIDNLKFDTHKKSIAIYVSPVFEKVVYLDIPVEEKIIIDESFEIRDLVYSKKQMHKYLVLLLSGKEIKMYLANTETFVRLTLDTPEHVLAYINDIPERVANFSDMSDRKEIVMDKFLHHIDNALDSILNTYQLPLVILGPDRILGHFKSLTKHAGAVVDYIHGNYIDSTLNELKALLSPHIIEWKKQMQQELFQQLEDAASAKKLAVGMKEVWHEAMNQKGKLLIVEKNYMYAAQQGGSDDIIDKAIEANNYFSYIKDAVDEVIEKVLENGGDVEFVEKDFLTDFQHIALILFY